MILWNLEKCSFKNIEGDIHLVLYVQTILSFFALCSIMGDLYSLEYYRLWLTDHVIAKVRRLNEKWFTKFFSTEYYTLSSYVD